MAKKSLTKVIIAAAIILVIFLPPFAKYQRLRYKNKCLAERIKALKKESKSMEEEKSRLEKDITYIEGRARERIGVVRKGEIVIKEAPPSQMKK